MFFFFKLLHQGGPSKRLIVSHCLWALLVVSKIPPLDPNNHKEWRVLIPRNMGEITPKNEGNVGSHGMASKLFSYPIWSSIQKGFWDGIASSFLPRLKVVMATWEKSYLRDIRSASRNKHDVLGQQKNWKLHVLSVNLSISNMNLDLPEMLEHFGRFYYSMLTWATWERWRHHDSPRATEEHVTVVTSCDSATSLQQCRIGFVT